MYHDMELMYHDMELMYHDMELMYHDMELMYHVMVHKFQGLVHKSSEGSFSLPLILSYIINIQSNILQKKEHALCLMPVALLPWLHAVHTEISKCQKNKKDLF